ncbi:MAG: hypothetical protein J7L23_01425 [Candidatus Diapherotrites archaeon]|nr:hypothetical protein [Candidatus Diapherotrites archaeon]
MRMQLFVLFLLLLSVASAMKVEQVIFPDGQSKITISVSKNFDKDLTNVGTLCSNLSSSPFHSVFSDVSCKDEGDSIVISGTKMLSGSDGFKPNPSIFESTYSFAATREFMSNLVSEDSIAWGAVPLNIKLNVLPSKGITIPYTIEMPGSLKASKNIYSISDNKVKANLVDLYIYNNLVSVDSTKTSWKSFATLIIMLVMAVGILVVWVSYFYLKSKI